MNTKYIAIFLSAVALLSASITACTLSQKTSPTPTPPGLPPATSFPALTPSSLTALPASGIGTPGVSTPGAQRSGSGDICSDPQVSALIDSLKSAVTTANGQTLSSIVSPSSGVDVAYFHNGNVIHYDQNQARFLFETTYQADWGAEPGSGAAKVGSFHDVVVPALAKIFSQPYTLHCNELKYGGASYPVKFPYDKGYYSIYFPGTQTNGNMDWQTWVVGIEYVGGKPYIYALMQFFWEP